MSKKPLPAVASLLAGLAMAGLSVDPAWARGYNEQGVFAFFDGLTDWIGFGNLSGDWRHLFIYALVAFSFPFGYLSDLAFTERGFGRILNSLIGAAGFCIGLRLFLPHLGAFQNETDTTRFNLGIIAAGSGAAFALLFAALTKAVVKHLATSLLARPARRARATQGKPAEEAEPRLAMALRKKD